MPDALDLLHQDHQAVSHLFDAMGTTGGSQQRRELRDQILQALSLHTSLEEELLYPLVHERVPEGAGFASVSLEEHAKAKEQMQKLAKLQPEDPLFDPSVGELLKEVKVHVADEEMQLFPRVRAVISDGELQELGARLQERKQS